MTAGRRTDWIGIILAAVMWALWLIGWLLDIQSFPWFLLTMGIYLVAMVAFLVWWFTRRSFTWVQRLGVPVAAVGAGIVLGLLTRRTITVPMFLVQSGLPVVLTVWAAWVLASRSLAHRARTAGLVAGVILAWTPFL